MWLGNRDRRLFTAASLLALSGENRVRVGAVLSKGRTVLSEAFNTSRNEVPNVPYGHATVHAERMALRGHEHRFNCTLYVARIGLNGQLMPSLPCRDCMIHIEEGTAVHQLVYLDENYELRKVRV